MEILKVLIPIVVAHAAVLVAIIVVIKKLLLNDTMAAVARIKQVEAEVRKKEEGIRREIEEHEQEFAKKKADAEAELQQQKLMAEKEATKLREAAVAEAKKEGERIIEQAKRNEQSMKEQILLEMEEKAVTYGSEVFKLVISETVNQEMNRAFISELLDALDQVDAGSITVDASSASFKSSHPIVDDQKQRLKSLLHDKFGADIEVNETIDESLLAGMAFKLGSLEIDGSLVNRMKEAASEVKKTI